MRPFEARRFIFPHFIAMAMSIYFTLADGSVF